MAGTEHWDELWLNVNLATMSRRGDDPLGLVEDGALAVRDGRIAWIGSKSDVPAAPAGNAQAHDGGGQWMLPGFIDCHTHLVYAGDRCGEMERRLNGESYADIARSGGGIQSTVNAVRRADEAQLVSESRPRLEAMLREGVTTVEIKSGYGLNWQEEAKMLRAIRSLAAGAPVRIVSTFLGAHAVPREYAGRAQHYVDEICEVMLPSISRENLADAVDAYCEDIAFSPRQVEQVLGKAKALGLPIKLHADQLTDGDGASLAARLGALSADHLEYTSDAGLKAMATAGTVAVLLPGAFLSMKETRRPPVTAMRRHGVRMALASDCNPGTSPYASTLLMLNLGCLLFELTPAEALLGLTAHAARALGLFPEIGTLETGKRAEFALWPVPHPRNLCLSFGQWRPTSVRNPGAGKFDP